MVFMFPHFEFKLRIQGQFLFMFLHVIMG